MAVTNVGSIEMKLEVVALGVADIDRAKAFYEGLGWRLDADISVGDDFRVVQLTPPGSECSIHFGKGVTVAVPGSLDHLFLVVDDIDAARADLLAHGVDVSEVFHREGENPRVGGRDPEDRPYSAYASFEDPDGNGWLLQEIKTRLPGREWESKPAKAVDIATLAGFLSEAEERHGNYEKTHVAHHWWDWYAPYLSARQNGESPEEAVAAANRYMDEVKHVLPR